ncbi:hypothetical protein PV10_04602 [Exophiala mesophila]|uniref:Ribosome biogenesis protein NOP53 n=1 Tax=Exophiala mesophila TaxID=212818 RepID=A0A0D2A2X2_EXOME|nr:uncharacterized protein PV10_04602 [Exophiala mesophila]KIV93388.1 hypothetical protein PV10_04602 [Exophiala mesophila]
MASSTGPPQQHKQPSRKGKKAWRKNVDITQVQQGLDQLREEIIQGGPIAERPSEELFALDTKGSEDIKKKYKLHKPLKVDEILSRRSAVPAVDSRKRHSSGVTDGVIEPSSKRQKPDWVSKKEVQRLKAGLNVTSRLNTDNIEEDVSGFDLWDAPASDQAAQAPSSDLIPKPRAKVAPRTLSRPPIALTASGRPVQPVPQPDAGTSYNPAYEDWDELITKEGEKEVNAERLRLEKAQAAAEREARVAALAALPETNTAEDESAWEGFETEDDEAQALRKKRPQRKTISQRNKIKRRKLAEQLAKHEKRMGDKQKQTEEMIMALIKQGENQELSDVLAAQQEADDGDDRVLRRRRLGNTTILEKPLELVLPDELQESLRRLKPEGNLLSDRFRNLLVNGKLETRKANVQHKRAQKKLTTKWSHKDFTIKV